LCGQAAKPELGALRERGQHSWEFRFLHKTGEYRWVHSEMRRVSAAEGRPVAHSVIVQKHGGRISFETEMGMGTTFVVRLPLEPGNPAG